MLEKLTKTVFVPLTERFNGLWVDGPEERSQQNEQSLDVMTKAEELLDRWRQEEITFDQMRIEAKYHSLQMGLPERAIFKCICYITNPSREV